MLAEDLSDPAREDEVMARFSDQAEACDPLLGRDGPAVIAETGFF